jgi:hypothetical protein
MGPCPVASGSAGVSSVNAFTGKAYRKRHFYARKGCVKEKISVSNY